jgi:hypothetical protein
MTRMSREFSLVLLGAGILTAGYFLWPEEDLGARADQQAAQQVGGTGRHGHMGHLVFLHSRHSGGTTPARANITRSGFGGLGRSISVGA